jgi:hypothetical protein
VEHTKSSVRKEIKEKMNNIYHIRVRISPPIIELTRKQKGSKTEKHCKKITKIESFWPYSLLDLLIDKNIEKPKADTFLSIIIPIIYRPKILS